MNQKTILRGQIFSCHLVVILKILDNLDNVFENTVARQVIADIKSVFVRDEEAHNHTGLDYLQSRLTSLILMIGLIICPIFAWIYHVLGDPVLSFGCLSGMVIALLLGFAKNTPQGSVLVREVIAFTALFLSLLITVRSGGVSSPLIFWIVIGPILAIISSGRKAGLEWTAINLAAILVISAAEDLGFKFTPIIKNLEAVYFISSMTLILVLIAIVLIFESMSRQLIKKLKESNEHNIELATLDPLTSVYNRREIIRLLEFEITKATRKQTALTLALIDIDNFKHINDSYGHNIGDDVLITMSKTLNMIKRKMDHFGRLGGEEFLLIMPETNPGNSKGLIERLHEKVKEVSKTEGRAITLSIGICEFKNGMTCHDLIELADQAMYRAKSQGKNQIQFHEDSVF